MVIIYVFLSATFLLDFNFLKNLQLDFRLKNILRTWFIVYWYLKLL